MVGQGAGPSRRSHTKSRKGCKTCKRRHIRCDETFPQCRNCTKHQVRCDYMENLDTDTEQQSPERSTPALTPGEENRIEQWQQTGSFPYPDLQVYPPPPSHEYSANELRLINHLSSISNDLLLKGSTNLTVWTHKMSKFLSIASSYPFVMHALLSFSANHLAWVQGSNDTRNLNIYHGSIALRGLHEAINTFSPANADAVLAASLLMLWQATSWRSWSSLRAGVQTVLNTMRSWGQESLFTEYVAEEDLIATSFRIHRRRSSISSAERINILYQISQALQGVQIALSGRETELHWTGQLFDYIRRLQAMDRAQTPDEQLGQLYYLRKWLFWVPVSLLRRPDGQGPAMLVLAHFYAAALALEPLFPDLGSSFCSGLALPPLEAIITLTDSMQAEQAMSPALIQIMDLMHFPRNIALNYRARALHEQHIAMASTSVPFDYSQEVFTPVSMGNISPAFATPSLHTSASQSSSGTPTSFLEVPSNQGGFTYGTQGWGIPSPAFPAQHYQSQDEQMYGYTNFRGGCVTASASIWT